MKEEEDEEENKEGELGKKGNSVCERPRSAIPTDHSSSILHGKQIGHLLLVLECFAK
jgi:hypothetical protein